MRLSFFQSFSLEFTNWLHMHITITNNVMTRDPIGSRNKDGVYCQLHSKKQVVCQVFRNKVLVNG